MYGSQSDATMEVVFLNPQLLRMPGCLELGTETRRSLVSGTELRGWREEESQTEFYTEGGPQDIRPDLLPPL